MNVLLRNIWQQDSLEHLFHSKKGNFDYDKDDLVISKCLFEGRKTFTIHLSFSNSNDSFEKTFIYQINLMY